MLRVGLTGGIGSGKSSAAHYFGELGVPVIDADEIAHQLTTAGSPLLRKIAEHFGEQILKEDGELNRSMLRDIIFKKLNEKAWLEKILHPPIMEVIRTQLASLKAPYCILMIPLLIEYGKIDFIDRILVIDVSEQHQIERAQERDKSLSKDVEAIMQTQSSREKRLAVADDVIENDEDLQTLKRKVKRLHDVYLKIAG